MAAPDALDHRRVAEQGGAVRMMGGGGKPEAPAYKQPGRWKQPRNQGTKIQPEPRAAHFSRTFSSSFRFLGWLSLPVSERSRTSVGFVPLVAEGDVHAHSIDGWKVVRNCTRVLLSRTPPTTRFRNLLVGHGTASAKAGSVSATQFETMTR